MNTFSDKFVHCHGGYQETSRRFTSVSGRTTAEVTGPHRIGAGFGQMQVPQFFEYTEQGNVFQVLEKIWSDQQHNKVEGV